MRPSINEYYISMLPLVASRATCPRRSVGAIIVDENGVLVSMGYNGPPSGVAHCTELPCAGAIDQSGDNNRCIATHAETNAVLRAAASRLVPHVIYSSTTPCFYCSKIIISAKIKKVISLSLYKGDTAGLDLLQRSGIPVLLWEDGHCAVTAWSYPPGIHPEFRLIK